MGGIVLTKDNLFSNLSDTDFLCGDIQQSYSPFCSSIGLLVHPEENGIGELVFHYNRATRTVFRKAIDFHAGYDCKASDFTQLHCTDNSLSLSFYDTNSFSVRCKSKNSVALFTEPDQATGTYWLDVSDPSVCFILGYSQNADARDPDSAVPFAIGIALQAGTSCVSDKSISIVPDKNDNIQFAVCVELLNYDLKRIRNRLTAAPTDIDEAAKATLCWAKKCVKDLSLPVIDDRQADMLRYSILGLLFNLTAAEGQLHRHVSAFPNRGTYPTHFLWDTCFQNLAYEELSLSLAEDLLLQNIDTQRADGKYPQFICSTWERPHDTQPALIGWAACRLAKKTKSKDFICKVIPSLEANTNWWLTQRMTDCGLIFTPGGLETGQDNSPRFDNGPAISADMNAFLLRQMYCISELYAMLDNTEKSNEWNRNADAYAIKIRDVLYSPRDMFFFDLDLHTRRQIPVVSPSGLLPIWAGNVLQEEEAKACIRRHLLSPESMFGPVPFPSVSYSDPTYDAADWWRGPMWLPIAYLMLECLERYGYKKERDLAAQRLCGIVWKDREMHELFQSKTGEGMGAAQQGWTCAVYLRLLRRLSSDAAGLL